MGWPGSGTNCKCRYCKRKSVDKGRLNRIGRAREKRIAALEMLPDELARITEDAVSDEHVAAADKCEASGTICRCFEEVEP